MDNVLTTYVKGYAAHNFLMDNEQAASPFFQGVRLKIDENTGQGWSEILRIQNGLYVGLADYRLNHKLEFSSSSMDYPCQLNILLSGQFQFQTQGGKKQTVTAGDLWFVPTGSIEQTTFSLPDEFFCGLTLGLSHNLIEAWLGTSSCEASKNLEKLLLGKAGARSSPGEHAVHLARSMKQHSEFIRLTKNIIYTRRKTLPDKLRFESLTLDLLSKILSMESSSTGCAERIKKINRAVDEAVDILRKEWDTPPTISTLARRTKVNECYLKKWFREQMDMSIGEYIRELRMTKALELIETGRYSILETAVYVGYSNPGHFSAAFKKYYGHLPSYYLPRS